MMVFQTRYGHFEFMVMSFGLANTLVIFMDLMSRVFNPYLDMFIVVLTNDILIYSPGEQEQMEHLRVVLPTVSEQKLYAKFDKANLG